MLINNKLMARIAKKLISTWILLPVYWDMQTARILHTLSGACSNSSRKIALGAPFILLGMILTASGAVIWGIIAFAPAVLILGQPIKTRLVQRILVWHLPKLVPALSSASSTRADLLKLGINQSTVEGILSQCETEEEVIIAEIDQQNRMLGRVEALSSSDAFSVDKEKFEKRKRHRIELVVIAGTLAIKKVYRNYDCFANELLALSALASLPMVPKLVAVKRKQRIIYQSFLPGKNLGSILAENGITVEDQFRFTYQYPGIGNWPNNIGTPAERPHILECTQTALKPLHIECLSELLTAVHRAGVAVKDVKYGNIIVGDDQLFMCDFDGAEIFQSNSRRFLSKRELEHDKFNYLFGTNLQSTTLQLTEHSEMARKQINLHRPPVYYGKGYGSGEVGSLESGSGQWLYIRRAMPDLSGKTVLDLGCKDGVLPLEMLRAGARKVTAYELDPVYSMFAQSNHKWFELVDNQAYHFELTQEPMHKICDRNLLPYDIATAFCSLYQEEPEEMKRIVACLSQVVKIFVVQCNENPEEHSGSQLERASRPYLQSLLAENGFPKQQVFAPSYSMQPLIIARRK